MPEHIPRLKRPAEGLFELNCQCGQLEFMGSQTAVQSAWDNHLTLAGVSRAQAWRLDFRVVTAIPPAPPVPRPSVPQKSTRSSVATRAPAPPWTPDRAYRANEAFDAYRLATEAATSNDHPRLSQGQKQCLRRSLQAAASSIGGDTFTSEGLRRALAELTEEHELTIARSVNHFEKLLVDNAEVRWRFREALRLLSEWGVSVYIRPQWQAALGIDKEGEA